MATPNLNRLEFWGQQLSVACGKDHLLSHSNHFLEWCNVLGGHKVCYQTILQAQTCNIQQLSAIFKLYCGNLAKRKAFH